MAENHVTIYYTKIDGAPDFDLSKLSLDGSTVEFPLLQNTFSLFKVAPFKEPSDSTFSLCNFPSIESATEVATSQDQNTTQVKNKNIQQRLIQQQVSKLLKQKVLGKEYSSITLGEHGKPTLPSASVHFNVSHSENLVGIALCEKEIGFDIQAPRKFSEFLVQKAFTKNEQEWLNSKNDLPNQVARNSALFENNNYSTLLATQYEFNSPDNEKDAGKFEKKAVQSDKDKRFLLLWTAKESYVKAIGTGFTIPPASFDILPTGEELKKLDNWLDRQELHHSINPNVFSWQKTIADKEYRFSLTFQEGYAFCVCTL